MLVLVWRPMFLSWVHKPCWNKESTKIKTVFLKNKRIVAEKKVSAETPSKSGVFMGKKQQHQASQRQGWAVSLRPLGRVACLVFLHKKNDKISLVFWTLPPVETSNLMQFWVNFGSLKNEALLGVANFETHNRPSQYIKTPGCWWQKNPPHHSRVRRTPSTWLFPSASLQQENDLEKRVIFKIHNHGDHSWAARWVEMANRLTLSVFLFDPLATILG